MGLPPRKAKAPRPSRRKMRELLRPIGLDEVKSLRLAAVLGPNEAEALRGDLLAVRGQMIDLDGSQLTKLGGLGLQVLLSAHATWRQDGQRLRLLEPSDALKQGLALVGAEHFFQIASSGETL